MIEPAAGADRATLAFLLAAYEEEDVDNGKGGTEQRTVLRLHPSLAPIKVAVLPLSKNERLVPVADEVAALLRPRAMIDVDVAGSIGRRYRRQDEVGTPLCVTVDFDTLDDRAVTIRDRDTMSQERVPIDGLLGELKERLRRMTDNYYEELGVEPGASRDELPRSAPSARRRSRGRPREEGRHRGAAAGEPRRGRARAVGVERALRSVPAPALRRAASVGESEPAGDVELVDDDAGATQGTGAELTGWRKLLAPPPPKDAGGGNGNGNGNGKKPARRTDRNGRPRPSPRSCCPPGMTIAEPRVRGMALLFDISILIVIFFAVSLVVPRLIQSDYQDIQDRITKVDRPQGRARERHRRAEGRSTTPRPPARRRARSPT